MLSLLLSLLLSSQAALQPQTKKQLMEWIKECDGGVKNHSEPNTWDVTLVTDMSCLFYGMENFNEPIDQWNTSQVDDMSYMFYRASSFNQPITMDTSKVINMGGMFKGATAMTHPIPSLKEAAQVEAAGEEKEAAVSNFLLKVLRIKEFLLLLKLTLFFDASLPLLV